mmetsp:Transcript_7924/g.25232  ORF Transcript_7924/g.25232 Transcript_7924/m.25232 type:complete len:232 (-) Transcript_7924:37-732(-)
MTGPSPTASAACSAATPSTSRRVASRRRSSSTTSRTSWTSPSCRSTSWAAARATGTCAPSRPARWSRAAASSRWTLPGRRPRACSSSRRAASPASASSSLPRPARPGTRTTATWSRSCSTRRPSPAPSTSSTPRPWLPSPWPACRCRIACPRASTPSGSRAPSSPRRDRRNSVMLWRARCEPRHVVFDASLFTPLEARYNKTRVSSRPALRLEACLVRLQPWRFHCSLITT